MDRTQDAGPSGIGGWLLLPMIGLLASVAKLGLQIVRDFLPVLKPEVWNVLTDPASPAYHPLWRPLLVFEMAFTSGLLIFVLCLIYLFFTKSRRLPRGFMLLMVANVLLQLADLIFGTFIPAVAAAPQAPAVISIGGAAIACAIWIPYFSSSRRVRNTFVR